MSKNEFKISISNISVKISKEDLRKLFKDSGDIM